MISRFFGAPKVSQSDLLEAYRPIVRVYLAATSVYFLIFSVLHIVVIGGAAGFGLGMLSAVTAAYCLTSRSILGRGMSRPATVELIVLGHNFLLVAGVAALMVVRYGIGQLTYFPIIILGFALVSPTLRTSVTSIVVALLTAGFLTPSKDLAEYGYAIGVAAFGSLLAFTLLQTALRREIHTRSQLIESEQRHRRLAENIGDVVFTTDLDGNFEYVSPSVKALTGLGPEAWLGKNMRDEIVAEDEVNTLDYFRQNKPIPTGRDNEFRYRRSDGSIGWAQGHPTIIHDDDGKPVGLMSVVRDVTERRAIEDELRHKSAEAEAAALAKSEFLANMSHEIRTPLIGVLGFAGLLEALPDLPATARSYVSRISTSSQALLSVVNDILDFSKLEADRIELDPQPFDPEALVSETVGLIAAEAERKGLVLTTEVEGELPSALLADSARVRQALLNLLSNAIKFTEAGQVHVRLAYRREAGGELRIAVTDTGIGIPSDRVDKLFQRFFQVDGSNTRQYGGTGLGLAISKSLVELMGGEIGVESREGEGSTFWFKVAAPVTAASQSEPVAADPQVAAAARILMVDDVAINRELVRTMLGPFDYDITEAANGAEAVQAAMSAPFDLILMDLQMPGMDGLAATRAIRANSDLNRQTPIVALSANVLPVHVAECREAGMDDHIAKPISPAELLTKIAEWSGLGSAEAVAQL